MDRTRSITFDKKAQDNLPPEIKAKMKRDRQNSSFKQAILLLKNAKTKDDVLDAIYLKDQLTWFDLDEGLKDEWNDHYGDACRMYSISES